MAVQSLRTLSQQPCLPNTPQFVCMCERSVRFLLIVVAFTFAVHVRVAWILTNSFFLGGGVNLRCLSITFNSFYNLVSCLESL